MLKFAARKGIWSLVRDVTCSCSKVAGFSSETMASAAAKNAYWRSHSSLVADVARSWANCSSRAACLLSVLARLLRRKRRSEPSTSDTVPVRGVHVVSCFNNILDGYIMLWRVEKFRVLPKRKWFVVSLCSCSGSARGPETMLCCQFFRVGRVARRIAPSWLCS